MGLEWDAVSQEILLIVTTIIVWNDHGHLNTDVWDSPYWKKAENFAEPTPAHQKANLSLFDRLYHGTGGPFHTSYSHSYGASHRHWHATLNKLGVKTNTSHFSGSNVGCWTTLTGVTPDRERCYSATAYYRPVSDRQNLFLLTEATAQEVLLEREDDQWVARGVKFTRQGKEYSIKTLGEIVICGGSVSSPQLLELSGIGNPSILQAGGIECKVASPRVGENFQEHMSTMPIPLVFMIIDKLIVTAMVVELDSSVVTPDDLRADPALAAAADKQYALDRTGPRTTIPSSVAYLPFSHIIPADELQRWGQDLLDSSGSLHKQRNRLLVERLTTDQNLGQIEFYFDVSMYSPYFKTEPGKKYGTMLMMLQYPFSTGSMHIPPTPPGKDRVTAEDKPVIDPRYYLGWGGDIDFRTMSLCERFADKICRTEPLSSIIVRRVFPPEKEGGSDEAEDFSDWVRDTTITDWHPVGTCAMGGHEGIKGGVVDDRLRVYGVKGLRVCDASIMPLQIAAHLQATVYAIGEKGADLIKEDWKATRKAANVNGIPSTNGVNGLNGAIH